ncbi:hypothetical protein BH09PSE2_BH09PSE2_01110 [soil metagenome]
MPTDQEDDPAYKSWVAECEETERRIEAGLDETIPLEEVRRRFEARWAAENQAAIHAAE